MKKTREKQPVLAAWILVRTIRDEDRLSILSDFSEIYDELIGERGHFMACRWYWAQVVRSIPMFILNYFFWGFIMFKNYLKVAFRNMKKHKVYSFINIVGLTIGITCSVLMFLWVQNELNYDRFHNNAKELHRILLDPLKAATTHEAVSPPILARKMKDEIPEVANATRILPAGRQLFAHENMTHYEERGLLADPSFFEMFSFPFIQGDPTTALKNLHSLVLTEEVAKKFFRNTNPIGKTITLNNRTDYKVTGVIADVPANSHLQFKFVRSFELLGKAGRNLETWSNVSFYTYVQLRKNSSVEDVNSKLKLIIEREDPGHNLYYLQPLTRIHLHSKFNFDLAAHGNIIYVYVFTAAGLFVLLIACFNFVNLATARSGIRAKEVGMRKVVGAKKSDIIKQFYIESLLTSLIALLLAVVLILMLLPTFNNLFGKELAFTLSGNMELILGLIAIAILTGILSGSYPALFLSTFHPIKVIRGNLKSGNRGTWFRKILVVTQFSLTITLFIGTAVVHSQMSHIKGKYLGYDKEHIVAFPLRGDMQKNFETLKNDLLQNTAIVNVTGTSSLPTHIGSGTSSAWWEGKEDGVRIQMQVNSVDSDYLDTFKMEMSQGRFFSREYPTDEQAFVLNEAAVKAMGMESPVGKRFKATGKEGSIIGIIKDFNYKSLHTAIEPLILVMDPRVYYACVRINADKISAAIRSLEDTWNKLVPGLPFEYSFLDGRINNLYRAEQRMAKVFNSSTVLALFIACLGLFGMASFSAERRTKEIGIRKVLGASVPSVVSMLSKEYAKLVLISNLIAWPTAYYVMNQWLRGFAYRTNIQIWTFLAAAATALLIAVLTVSYHTIKTATANPVDSLRYE